MYGSTILLLPQFRGPEITDYTFGGVVDVMPDPFHQVIEGSFTGRIVTPLFGKNEDDLVYGMSSHSGMSGAHQKFERTLIGMLKSRDFPFLHYPVSRLLHATASNRLQMQQNAARILTCDYWGPLSGVGYGAYLSAIITATEDYRAENSLLSGEVMRYAWWGETFGLLQFRLWDGQTSAQQVGVGFEALAKPLQSIGQVIDYTISVVEGVQGFCHWGNY